MFIDALTPREPVPTTDPKAEHGAANPHLGTSAAEVDVHARVHGDGTACPICQLQVSNPRGAFPNPAASVIAAVGALLHLP